MLKQRELLACPDGKGGLILLKVGGRQSGVTLKQGENILTAGAEFDLTDRFSDYLVDGQQPGNDQVWGKEAAAVHAETKDPAITRYRPLIIRAESRVDPATARQRAAWERTVRAARSVSVSVTVQGFRQGAGGAGPLWLENALTDVDIPFLRVGQQLVTASVTYRRDAEGGSTTTLVLKDPDSFKPEPKKQPSTGTGSPGREGDIRIEADKDILTRSAEQAAKAHIAIKEGAG